MLLFAALLTAGSLLAASPESGISHIACSACDEWNVAREPFRVYGNTWYVGTRGLSAILVTSDEGHVLIDGALPQSAPLIRDNIETLGFRIEDVKLILNSHVHFDHAAGIAQLQRWSGASVAASPRAATVLESGESGPDDPQYGELIPFEPVKNVRKIADGDILRVGALALQAHFTPGHTPGGTSWSWRSCEGERCLDVVYADSLTPISADGFRFSGSESYPSAVEDFERSFSTLESLPCSVLLAPHPFAIGLFDSLAAREKGQADALIDAGGCRRYVEKARQWLAQRLERERTKAEQ